MIYLIIPILILFIYLLWVVDNHGVLESWSDSYREIKDKWKFQLTLVLLGLGVGLFGWFTVHSYLLPISGLGLVTVGLAPRFWLKTQGIIHSAGALLGALAGLLSVGVDFHLWWVSALAIALIGIIKFKKISNATWWMETTAFLAIIIGILATSNKKKGDK